MAPLSERQPDHTQDPRQAERGDQLPEEGPESQVPDDEGGAADAGAAGAGTQNAPDPAGDGGGGEDATGGEGSQSTGNPDAAG